MVPGFNTDFKYRGDTYHVQTEDNGVGNPVVVTLLYHKGAILASRRTPYHDLVGRSGFEPELKELMKNQHKDLMRALLAGAYDKNGAAPAIAGSSGEHPEAAAAAVAATTSKPQPRTVPAPVASPRAVPQPAATPVASPRVTPQPTAAPVASPRVAPQPTAAPIRATAPRTPAPTLDEAIRHYLEEFAATAAAIR